MCLNMACSGEVVMTGKIFINYRRDDSPGTAGAPFGTSTLGLFGRSGTPWQCLNFLPEPQGAWVVAARSGRFADWLSRIADGFSRRSAAGKPVRIMLRRGGGDQVIYLIDIVATYLLISGKEGRAAATMQCDSQEFCCRTMAWRYCFRARDGYSIAAGEIQ
jgi:hypothetical protein